MAKPLLRKKARLLRKNGFGVKTIAYKLQVSSSTVSQWCKDIELTPIQIATLEKRQHDPFYGRRLAYAKAQQKKRQDKTLNLLHQGVKDVGKLSKRELFISGISLYWAEGFKKDNQVGFANSDPTMTQYFILWLEQCCGVNKSALKLRVGVNESYRDKIQVIESFWSKTLNIPNNQFQKPFFQRVQWKKQYDHPENYHGVLRIRVAKSTDFLRKIHGWIEGLKHNSLAD
ncbi:MAG: hypothetical protein NTY06_01285 [Candidatus Gottesmanbacteria bacterium]|nr:hypothetical protein [Candidatus Gottesmanbacteria bacterium]